ncbi:MAG: 4Fe-4S dicluster domain-containing protein [Anaerolineales bacterium]
MSKFPVDRNVIVWGDTPEAERAVQELEMLGYNAQQVAPSLNGSGEDTPAAMKGHVGGFTLSLREGESMRSHRASALVIATGNERAFPTDRYAFPLSSRVLSTAQMRQRLDATKPASTAQGEQQILLALDLESETSREMTSEVFRLAMRLRQERYAEVFLFYRDLKVDAPGLERLTREMRQQGIVFCRYGEAEIATGEDSVYIGYREGEIEGDLLVLPETVQPRPDTEALAALLGARVGEDGYFQTLNVQGYRAGLSNRRGIFFAGRCHMDCDVTEAQEDATQVAASVDALLRTGFLEPDSVIAKVEASECVRCLSCIRTCPHGAVELAAYENTVAARVIEVACQACGACVAGCPAQAISMVGQTLPAWMASPQEG